MYELGVDLTWRFPSRRLGDERLAGCKPILGNPMDTETLREFRVK